MKNKFTIREDGVAEIVLTQGQVALVDAEDLPVVAEYRWRANHLARRCWYAVSGGRPTVLMHRLLMNAGGRQLVDHANHDCLDNRRSNLRLCTKAGNMANSRKFKGTSSRYKGVSWDKPCGKWRAQIQSGGKQRYLGIFDDAREAASVYDKAAVELFGEYALPNFATSG